IIGAPAYPARHLSIESIFEYGSRAGVWRILREFERRRLPLTIFGVSMALERDREVTSAFVELGHEIASHGWRWIHYQEIDEETEREHMRIACEIIQRLTGEHFFTYLRDSFDVLYAEGEETPKMMSIGMHCSTSGPSRPVYGAPTI